MPRYALAFGPTVSSILEFATDEEAVDYAIGQPTATLLERCDSGRTIWTRPADDQRAAG